MNKQGKTVFVPGGRASACRALLTALLLLAAVGAVSSQDVSSVRSGAVLALNPTPDKVISGTYRHIELDRLGNLFLTGTNQITVYNKQGDSVRHYDNIRSYGQISELDVTNPLKIAVYYRDFGTIVVLDRYLSPVNTIDLRKAGIWEAQTIATSYDNQYWVYDKQEAKIKKVDGQGRVSFVSSDLRQVFDQGIDPVKLIDQDGLLYSYDPGFGWYIFDYYGALKQKIAVEGLQDPQVAAGVLSGRKGSRLWLMRAGDQIATPVWQALSIDADQLRQSLIDPAGGRLWLLTPKDVRGYSVKIQPQ